MGGRKTNSHIGNLFRHTIQQDREGYGLTFFLERIGVYILSQQRNFLKAFLILSSDDWLSTQSTAFALVALSDYLAKYRVDGAMDFTYACGGKDGQVKTDNTGL